MKKLIIVFISLAVFLFLGKGEAYAQIKTFVQVGECPQLISGNDTCNADLYVATNDGNTYNVEADYGIDFRTGDSATYGSSNYLSTPSQYIHTTLPIGPNFQLVGTFSTQVQNNTGVCLTDIAGQIFARARVDVSSGQTVDNLYVEPGDVVNIGAMFNLRFVTKSDGSLAVGARVTISPRDSDPDYPAVGYYTVDPSGQVLGLHRYDCTTPHTVTVTLGSESKTITLNPSTNPTEPYICNGRGKDIPIQLEPAATPTPTPTPTPAPVVNTAGPLSCSGSPPALSASWTGNTLNSCNIYIRAGVTDYQISTACNGSWSESTLPGGPAVVGGGVYHLYASPNAGGGTIDGGQATCPTVTPTATPIPTPTPVGALNLQVTATPICTTSPATERITASWQPIGSSYWVSLQGAPGGDESLCTSVTSKTFDKQPAMNGVYTVGASAYSDLTCLNYIQNSAETKSVPTNLACPTPTPTLICPATYTISGTVTKQTGGGVNNAVVCLDPPAGGCATAAKKATTNPSGSYSIAGVTSGGAGHNVYLDPASLTGGQNVAPPNPVFVGGSVCTATTVNFSTTSGPTPTPPAGATPTPAPGVGCTLTASPNSGTPPLTSTVTLSPNIFASSRPADTVVTFTCGGSLGGSMNLNGQTTCSYSSVGTYTPHFTAKSSSQPSYNYDCSTTVTASDEPPPPPPVWSCNYTDPPDNAPSLTLDPDGKTLKVSYQYQSSQTPNVSFYRNSKLGFLPESGTLIGNQFGDQGVSFHRNPESSSYLYYQAQASNGAESSVSNTVGVATQPEEEGYSCSTPLFYDLANITGASQASSTANTMTFKLVYRVGITSLGGGGCNMQTGCQPTYTPPYLRLERSSGGGAYIPWDAAGSRTHRCIQQNTGRWWYQRNTCILSEWTATYVVGLPPGTSDTFTVTGYNDGQCSYKTANGSATFVGGTSGGTPPQVLIPSLSGSAQVSPENYQYVNLSWPQTQDGQQVKVYMAEGWNGRWPVAGNPLPQLPRVFDSSNNRWTFTATDDLSQLVPGTYYYGNSLYDRGFCSTVLTGQASFVWQMYDASAVVFVDDNHNGTWEGGSEDCYNQPITIYSTDVASGQVTSHNQPSGCSGGFKLPRGTHQISFTPPEGYGLTTPGTVTKTFPPNLQTAFFGISDTLAWWQTKEGDVRAKTSVSLNMPLAVPSVKFSLDGAGGSPGIVFYGTGGSTYFGYGRVSSTNWLGKEDFAGPVSTYDSLLTKVNQSGTTISDFSCQPGNNCNSPPASSGVYKMAGDGNLTVSSDWTVKDGKKIVIFVPGNLEIQGGANKTNVDVAAGSFLAFIVKGNITVNSSIGRTTSNSTSSNLEGWYITDGNFNTVDTGTSGKRLNIEGLVYLSQGALVNKDRDLGASNKTDPALFISYRTDLALNAPTIFSKSSIQWEEIAP